jgi:hypothetical protein
VRVYDCTILPLYSRQCHATLDSEDDHATLSCHLAPSGWCLDMSISRRLLGEKICRLRGSTVLSRSICSSLTVTYDLEICLHAGRRHPLRTLCRAIPEWTSQSDFHAMLLVSGMRRRSLEDRLHLLSRRSVMTFRSPLGPEPLRQVPRSQRCHGTPCR